MKNEISTAADFRKKHEDQTAEDGERIVLPSGLTVLAHRPGPDWWLRHLGRMPQGLAIRASSQAADAPTPTTEEIIEFSQYTIAIIREVIVSPKVRNHPGPNDIDPNWITDPDFQFILAYARGEIAADGQGLGRFRGQPASAPTGTDGEAVGM
jgi:hypothetical protein